MKKLLIPVLVIFVYAGTSAQKISPALETRLQGKTTLKAIMIEVESYYKEEGKTARYRQKGDESFEDDYMLWKRWEWWMLSHLDENGNFVNITKKNLQGIGYTEQKWGSMIADAPPITQNRIMLEGQYLAAKTNNAYGNWVNLGPNVPGTGIGSFKGIGRVDRIAFHPTIANIIYIGTPGGGVWKTTNGGSSWVPITDMLPTLAISGLVVSPTNGNVIYILTGDGDSGTGSLMAQYGARAESMGAFKSTDGGTTWFKTGELYTGNNFFTCNKLAISPTNGNYLVAATNQGLYRTINGGADWVMVRAGGFNDVKFKPSNDSVVYASTNTGVIYSTQGGRQNTWNGSTFSNSVAGAGRIELGVSPSNPNIVFALCATASAGTFTGLYRSSNSGSDFSLRSNTPNILGQQKDGSDENHQSGYDLCIAVKPDNANYLVTGGLTVWRTFNNNGGTSMVYSSVFKESFGTASEYIHPDVHDVAYNPLNNYLYAATDGGIYRSIDDGVSWTDLSQGVSTTMFYRMSMRDIDADGEMDGVGMIGGSQDNGVKYRNNAGTFFHIMCCDGFSGAISPADPNVLFMNSNSSFARSNDGGASQFSAVDSVTFFSPIAIDWNNPDTVYVGGGTVRRSHTGFVSPVIYNYSENASRVLITCPSNSARLYASAGNNVRRSDSRGILWTTLDGNLNWPTGTFTINDIKVQPTNSNTVLVCFGGFSAGNKIMLSSNAGSTWTNWTGGLPNVPFYSLAVSAEGVYAGSEIGVFFRNFGWSDWVPYYNGMPRVPVTGLAVNSNGLVYASTFGRGIWYSSRRTDCLNTITVSGAQQGPLFYQANNYISTTATATSGIGTEIFMQAGDSVILRPGFNIVEGNFLKAYIAGCNLGGLPSLDRGIVKQPPLPQLKELMPEKHKRTLFPGKINIHQGNLEFNISTVSKVEFVMKNKNGKWVEFFPTEIFQPGIYSLSIPDSAKEVGIKVGGKMMVAKVKNK